MTILISGASFPIIAAILGLVNCIARVIYGIGYFSSGAKGRVVGAIIGDIIVLGLIGLSVASFFFTLKDSTLFWPALSIFSLTLTCFLIGFIVAGGARDRIMNDEFVKRYAEQQKSLLKDVAK